MLVERQTLYHHQSSHKVFSLVLLGRQTSCWKEIISLPYWSGSEMEVSPKTSQLYSCSYACQTCVWNNLLWLWEVVSFIRWCVPQNGRRHCAKFSAPRLQPQQLPAAAAAGNHPCVDKLNVGRALSQTFFCEIAIINMSHKNESVRWQMFWLHV